MAAAKEALGHHTAIGDVGASVRRLISKSLWIIGTAIAIETAVLALAGDPGTLSFLCIGIGCFVVLAVWAESGEGLPIIPLLAVQNLLAYGLPIATHNETVTRYPSHELTSAGIEVLISSLAMILAWRVGMTIIRPASPLCYALQGFDERSEKLVRLGFALVIGSTVYEILRSIGILDVILDLLPPGSDSIIHVLISASSACGFFLSGMMLGRRATHRTLRVLFWSCLALQCFISASGFLLSSTVTVVFAALIGLFWGSGKIPWRFVIITVAILSFLNVGKFVMRERYWGEEGADSTPQFTLLEMPKYYSEWASASFDLLVNPTPEKSSWNKSEDLDPREQARAESKQTLLERINNLQNLLYVIDVMETSHIAPVDGATYTLIPPLLIPRILWPDKPRTHEGQILLNVHFGRQDLNATYQTYIAWGLLPEAFGNFGPKTGGIVLGVFLGFIFAWVERFLARKLLLSLEGFLAFTIFLGMANSYEMVASVLVTSVFQACIPIILASAPFVAPVLPKK